MKKSCLKIHIWMLDVNVWKRYDVGAWRKFSVKKPRLKVWVWGMSKLSLKKIYVGKFDIWVEQKHVWISDIALQNIHVWRLEKFFNQLLSAWCRLKNFSWKNLRLKVWCCLKKIMFDSLMLPGKIFFKKSKVESLKLREKNP